MICSCIHIVTNKQISRSRYKGTRYTVPLQVVFRRGAYQYIPREHKASVKCYTLSATTSEGNVCVVLKTHGTVPFLGMYTHDGIHNENNQKKGNTNCTYFFGSRAHKL